VILLHPVKLARELEEQYRSYLKTTFSFEDISLKQSFESGVDGGGLKKGPYVEATPVFELGRKTEDIFKEVLTTDVDLGLLKAVNGKRRLYQHQEEAIIKTRDHNVIIATGTGSGKTEAFLFPVLLHLYEEFKRGELGAGVRALILYPMNALANDQLRRLGNIMAVLEQEGSPFSFTYGRYTGETPENRKDKRRDAYARQRDALPGEMIFREDMRKEPPNILLTNYSMLEYLLLRPNDSPLFDNGNAKDWQYLVLDEIHQYRGAQGNEMGMLIRRLKQRLIEGGKIGKFTCIGTSASLVGEEDTPRRIASFAEGLFAEEFSSRDIIMGKRVESSFRGEKELSLSTYEMLEKMVQEEKVNKEELVREGLWHEDLNGLIAKEVAGEILKTDKRTESLVSLVSGKTVDFTELAREVFGSEIDSWEWLDRLISLMIGSVDRNTGQVLLSARYHFFLRALEGAYISYIPGKRIYLNKKVAQKVFEVAICRECGQHYIIGNISGGYLGEAIKDQGDLDYGPQYFLPLESEYLKEGKEKLRKLKLCVECGEVNEANSELVCGHNKSILVEEQGTNDEGKMNPCSVCQSISVDSVREVIHGSDGPNVVIATSLYRVLQGEDSRVLAFTDGRQEAAFFAWYLEDSYKEIYGKNVMVKVVKDLREYSQEGFSLAEVAIKVGYVFEQQGIFSSSLGDLERKYRIWQTVYNVILTYNRTALLNTGLLKLRIKWPGEMVIPEAMYSSPWSFDEEEAMNVLQQLFEYMRQNSAVEIICRDGVTLVWNDLGLQAKQTSVSLGGTKSWDGKRGNRVQYLSKVLQRKGLTKKEAEEEAVLLLRIIWEELVQKSSPEFLISSNEGYRINPEWYRLESISEEDLVYQCDLCGKIHSMSIRGVCTRYRCEGTLRPIRQDELAENHYRTLYEKSLPGPLRVEEHTAQLSSDKAREFQEALNKGEIDLLSSSTTFELGVDLENLNTVFLRNIPPEPFNYVQRVGRAGRRIGKVGFAVTYCRRNPHDLYHFNNPKPMMSGISRVPSISIQNEKIVQRHIATVAFAAFFKEYPDRFKEVRALFVDPDDPRGTRDIEGFLRQQQGRLEKTLKSIVPVSLYGKTGLNNGSWIERITGEESRLKQAEHEYTNDLRILRSIKEEAISKEDYDKAKWAKSRDETMNSEDILTFLSRKAVIPKYGFPIDVVELDINKYQENEGDISLNRDLSIAIAEFAPGVEVLANKKVWKSTGLKAIMGKNWPRYQYKRCSRHNFFVQWVAGDKVPLGQCCSDVMEGEYLIPQFGFVSADKPKDPRGRTSRSLSTRPYFAGHVVGNPDIIEFPQGNPLVLMKRATPGKMVVISEGFKGEGFTICETCGTGIKDLRKSHKNAFGRECNGIPRSSINLGHEFETDVVELRFQPVGRGKTGDMWFSYSLGYALVEGVAEVLDVPASDLSATVRYDEAAPIPPIIIYDDVPGGAGLVARLEEEQVLFEVLQTAYKRVNLNCCDEETSCYICLRNYRNQFAHRHLQRGLVRDYLREVLESW